MIKGSNTSRHSWKRWKAVDLFLVDRRSIRFFRVCLGLVLILTYLNYLPYATDLLSDSGVFSRANAIVGMGTERMSLYLANGTAAFAVALLLLSIACAVSIIVDWHTRISIFASFILFQSLVERNREMTFGLHTAMLSLLVWAFFLPFDDSEHLPKRPRKQILSVAALGLVLNAAAIMYGAGIAKFREFDFWIGNANALDQLTTYYTNVNPLTAWLRLFPGLLRFLSRSTVFIEFGIVPFLFIPFCTSFFRTIGLGIGALFFLGITLCIQVGVFPMVAFIPLLILTPGSVWDWWEKTAIRRSFRLWTSSVARATRALFRSVCILRHGILCLLPRLLAWGFLTVFLLATLNNSLRVKSPILTSVMERSGLSYLLYVVGLNNTWDWVYGGPMYTKLLIAEYVTNSGSFVENISDAPYRGIFYNYRMNYTNAIMRSDWVLNRYLQNHCSVPGNVVPVGAVVQSIKLFIATDESNVEKIVKTSKPYGWSICPRGLGSDLHPSDIAPLLQSDAGTLTAFPILEMQQSFGNVAFDRSVDGNALSLGDVRYAKGIGAHANGRMTFYVEGATHFSVTAGIDDEVKGSAFSSVVLRIEGDGKELYRSPLLVSSATPQKIQLSIVGVSRLSLIAEDAGIGKASTLNYDDHVSWVNPRVWKQ